MDVQVEYTISDIYAVTFQSWRRIVLRVLGLFAILIGVLVALFAFMEGVSVLAEIHWFPWKLYLGLVAFLLLFVFLVTPAISYLRARRRGFLGPHQFQLLDNGVQVDSPQGQSLLYWSAITRLIAARRRLFLFIGPMNALIVPKRAFADQDGFDLHVGEARRRWEAARAKQ